MASIFQRGRTHTTVFARAWTLMITWRSKLLSMLLPASPLTPIKINHYQTVTTNGKRHYCTTTLCECALQTPYDSMKLGMLPVLSTLSGTIAIKQYFFIAPGNAAASSRPSDLIKLTQECCYHSNRAIAAHGVTVLSNIAISCMEKELMAVEQDAVFGLESLLLMCSLDDSASAQVTLKRALSCKVKLVKCHPHLSQLVVEFLLCQLHTAQDAARILTCHSLAAIAMQLPVLGEGMLGDLMDLDKVIGRSAKDKQQELLAEQCLSGLQDSDYSAAMTAIAEALKSYQKEIASLTLICICNSLKTSPPPAIATTIALASGNELQRCGRISTQMKVSMDELYFRKALYADLYQSSFDVDSATLRNVELYLSCKVNPSNTDGFK
ncbi:UNVERIFIED_CONTAM: hypothetical protein FKN15_052516 [Acipenser sinensis]